MTWIVRLRSIIIFLFLAKKCSKTISLPMPLFKSLTMLNNANLEKRSCDTVECKQFLFHRTAENFIVKLFNFKL